MRSERSASVKKSALLVLLAALLCACGPAPEENVGTAEQAIGQVTGWVDGVFGSAGARFIQGWVCEPGNSNPITIHLYTGGPVGVGQLFGSFVANASPGDPGVSAACGNSAGHRFFINVTGDLFNRAGQSIYVYGIAQNGGPNNALSGSGNSTVPAPTTVATLDAVSPSGVAWGWAFDTQSSGTSITVNIYADGVGGQEAETGTLVWSGLANLSRPDVDNAYQITGNHGFSVQLPSWVTTDMHRISAYAVSVGGALAPLTGSPKVPGGSNITSQFSFTTSAVGFPSLWYGYNLPAGQLNLAGLSGTVSLTHSSNLYAEILFMVGYTPGACPTGGTSAQWGPPGTSVLWTDIVKAPASGTFTVPVNFTLPAGVPINNCLVVGINGGPVVASHSVTGNVNLVATYTQASATSAQVIDAAGEFCFGQSWGCQAATTDNTKSFANFTAITQRSSLRAIWGNISDSTFDGTSSFGAAPTGAWTAKNDVYIYHGSSCSQFSGNVNGPGNYYANIPADAIHLLSAPLSGGAGIGPAQTINFLQPGMTNGVTIYQTYQNVTLNPGDCLVTLYGMAGNGSFDNESQIRAIVQPF
jgi:hypothetical protein